ncbi:type III-B CRISPR-associated protein Cas10/Cmr2 [Thiorhodovibrio frisius]|uniref:CRISPR-associated protein n=1 Tax=Thiorhodovibrio frisius TaxID=631362 RepID=H8Z1Z5_9GAMM|nr:type III-B CRISPR-associated protein Cas10/Cmr2 [Thiorhodovibrio frisius]EIC21520.1 CRISPR-associated protein [Thiorhodovibrio frisius]WPL24104.1 CRISPR-associated protein Cas10/Cmr2, subtype III-B [Thiorhodovibrio frisius]
MDDTNTRLWQAKLHARLHDPAEKALVLLRDPAGHEGGTSKALQRLLGLTGNDSDSIPSDRDGLHGALFKDGIPKDLYALIRRADQWSAAADRPQWPMQALQVKTRSGEEKTLKVADWAQVRWSKQPVLIHPLTGAEYDLGRHGSLADTDFHDIKARSLAHFNRLRLTSGAGPDAPTDWQRTLLAYWRFGPELLEEKDFGKLGALWNLLPADTRVPDHSIWDHLDLASAFTGAFAADPEGEAALLALSIGPVQPFIAAARTTSDLWAGSHLLARLAWEAMRPVCEALGPDAILFPRLRGVPQVDLWLRDNCGLPGDWFKDCEWARGGTDSNPLFSAALPNRFVALVPRAQARALAEQVEQRVRAWLADLGEQVLAKLLDVDNIAPDPNFYCYRQMAEQLQGFPEVHWAAVPFGLIRETQVDGQRALDTAELSAAMAPFLGAEPGQDAGFLATPAWQVLQRETRWQDGTTFFSPNPGVLYPAVYDLAERVLAAAKTTRSFAQSEQRGWRCSLTGETEWLTTDPDQLATSYRQREDTLWAKVAKHRRAWAKSGEHLGALPAIKRLWPTLFAAEMEQALGADIKRFVVSTHAMTLVHGLNRWLESNGGLSQACREAMAIYRAPSVALPQGLLRRHGQVGGERLREAKQLAGLLEVARELEDAEEANRLERLVRQSLNENMSAESDEDAPIEAYYALLLMDGDRMGAWLAGGEDYAISYRDSFHPQVRAGFDAKAKNEPRLQAYAKQARALSPNRHLAISGALNDFALTLVRHVVEREFLGRVIYAGGDDVLAMLPVSDLLPAMARLRDAYSGRGADSADTDPRALRLGNGFAWLGSGSGGRLLRLMGERATASCGAVIAHHQAPLGMVLRELRQAESAAKNAGGRDAFSVTLIKRSGGIRRFSAKWGEPMAVLTALQAFLAEPDVSRRAVYNSLEWLKDLPDPDGDPRMLAELLGYQLARQTERRSTVDHRDLPGLARRLATLATAQREPLRWLENCLAVAEFLVRDCRVKIASTRAPGLPRELPAKAGALGEPA